MSRSATTSIGSQPAPCVGDPDAMVSYRVWPDGTVQAVEEGAAYTWMSDDYMRVEATSENEALRIALQREAENYKNDARHE